jgi:hypothetical protein
MRPALVTVAIAVGVAIVAVALIVGHSNVKQRNQQANVAMARFEQSLKRTGQTSPSAYQQLVTVVNKVDRKDALTPPELAVWRKAMADVNAQSAGVTKILDNWPEIRSRSAPAAAVEGLVAIT